MSEEFERKIRELRDSITKELSSLIERIRSEAKKVSDELSKISRSPAYEDLRKIRDIVTDAKALIRDFKHKLKEVEGEARSNIRKLRSEIRASSLTEGEKDRLINELIADVEDTLEDMADRVEDAIDALIDSISELRELFHKLGRKCGRWAIYAHRYPLEVGKIVGETISEALESARRAIERATTVISSVRIPESDAEIIDKLVDAGLFRSRNEALAFFVHKGIEASKELLKRVDEKLAEIKKLQEEVRRDLEELFKA